MRPGLTMRALPLALLILALAVRSAPARIGDGQLLVHWTAASRGGLLLLETPAGGEERASLAAVEGSPEATVRGEHLFPAMPPGRARLVVRSAENELLGAWPVEIAAELTTVVDLDLVHGMLRVETAHPDPFGNWESWGSHELATLPGMGAAAGLRMDVRPGPPSDAILDGRDLNDPTRLRPRPYGIFDDAVAVQIPLGTPPPALSSYAPWVLTNRAERTGATLEGGAGNAGLGFGKLAGELHDRLPILGGTEAIGVIQLLSLDDAGPTGIQSGALPNNNLRAVETRDRIYFRPGDRGLGLVEVYAYGQRRNHYLQELRQDAGHDPREDRAGLEASAAYDLVLGRARFSFEGDYGRTFLELGDGRGFDQFQNYRFGDPANDITTSDGLYWFGEQAGAIPPHFFNYYTRNLSSTFTGRFEAAVHFAPRDPLRVGGEIGRTTYRWYELVNPIVASQTGFAFGGGDLVSHLGYSLDGDSHTDAAPYGPPRPRTAALHASQRITLGTVSAEAGLRWESFRSGQLPLLRLSDPLGADTVFTAADQAGEKTWSGVDPRAGLYFGVGPTHFWLDAGRTRQDPPWIALYYSPNVVQHLAYLASSSMIKEPLNTYIIGNPRLAPETRRSAQLGILQEMGPRLQVRLSGHLAEVRDTWVARPVPAGRDTLDYYDNLGRRRERGVHLGVSALAGERVQIRMLYDLSRIETNVIEPAPLYRAWLRPDEPALGMGILETSPLAPVWLASGTGTYFPSLLDHTHRIALAFLTHVDNEMAGETLAPLFGDMDLAVTARIASGAPYTPIYVKSEGLLRTGESVGPALTPGHPRGGVNSARMPWSWQIDLQARRSVAFLGGSLGIVVEVLNLTGRHNPIEVYGATGEPDEDAWLSSPADPHNPGGPTNAEERGTAFAAEYPHRIDNPLNFGEGRTVRAALSLAY